MSSGLQNNFFQFVVDGNVYCATWFQKGEDVIYSAGNVDGVVILEIQTKLSQALQRGHESLLKELVDGVLNKIRGGRDGNCI